MSQPCPSNSTQCPLCAGENACPRTATGVCESPCWCERVDIAGELLRQVPVDDRGRVCLCARCVAEHNRRRNYRPEPIAGDHYLEAGGRLVFTAAYHLRRGYCCDNGCRHCPFDGVSEGRGA